MSSVFPLPQWLTDIATLATIVGFFITVWLLFAARDIRKSFLRRARLPQITSELEELSKSISEHLKKWSTDNKEVLNKFSIGKALLENLMPKLPPDEQKKCRDFITQLEPRKYLIFKASLSSISEDKAWDLYSELSAITTMLVQLGKDSKWD